MNTLIEQDFVDAAAQLGCEVPAIKAVSEVESAGAGFEADGRLKILFEAHKFHLFTGGYFDKTHPGISSPTWNRALYGRDQDAEWKRLALARDATEKAAKALVPGVDPFAALKSASWGRFQIMGFNHRMCGFEDAADMVRAFMTGERAHLMAFCKFVATKRAPGRAPFNGRTLDECLRRKDFTGFALGYNGPAAEENHYPAKMQAAYLKHGGRG